MTTRRLTMALAASLLSTACHFFVDVTPCLDGQACPGKQRCDKDLGICTSDAVTPPPAPGACGNALPIELGVPVTGDTTGIESADANVTCGAGGGDAGELVYTFTLDHDADIIFDGDPSIDTYDLELYVRQGDDDSACSDPFKELVCADAFNHGTREEIVFRVVANKPVFVFVDGFKVIDTGPFTLTLSEIQAGDAACVDDSTAVFCPIGTTCKDQTCQPVPGDSCDTAIRLNGTEGVESGDTTFKLSDLDVDAPCVGIDAGFRTPGNDFFYVVNVPAGATFHASLDNLDTVDLGIYLEPSCPTPDDGSCLAFADAGGNRFVENIDFTNTDAAATDIYVAVDAFAVEMHGPYTLTWSITGF